MLPPMITFAAGYKTPLSALLCVLLLSACALNTDRESSAAAEDFEQQRISIDLVNDIPIPEGAKLDTSTSLILGRGDRWTGRLVMNTPVDPVRAFALFQAQMPGYGWNTILSVQDRSSNIVFVRGDRISTLAIEPLGLRGSRIVMVTSLRPVDAPSESIFNASPNQSTDIGSGVSDAVSLQ